MKTITQHLRSHILETAGVFTPKSIPPLEELQKSEWSQQFEKYMRNRLIVGAIRYGLLNQPEKVKYNRVDSIRQRLDLYTETGNQEHLVDIANLCLLEFEEPNHKTAHWKAQDDGVHTAEAG